MRAGLLRHRVNVQKRTRSITAGGVDTVSYEHVDHRSASIKPRDVESQPADNNVMHVVEMRHNPNLTSHHRLLAPGTTAALSAAVNALVTTLPLDEALGEAGSSAEPAKDFRVRVNDELMLVTGGQGTTSLTVTRGYEGTTAAAHDAGDPVEVMRIFNIASIVNVNERDRTTQLLCTEER